MPGFFNYSAAAHMSIGAAVVVVHVSDKNTSVLSTPTQLAPPTSPTVSPLAGEMPIWPDNVAKTGLSITERTMQGYIGGLVVRG